MTDCGGIGAVPDEIRAVIPTDPYEQLDLARRITSLAIASRVSKLESEAGRLRLQASEKDRVIADLQDRLSRADRTSHEADARLREALEENIKLAKERDSLALTSKKLVRDLAKLETFKRHLMQSLSDENQSQAETVDIKPYDQPIVAPSWKDESSITRTSSNLVGGFSEKGNTIQNAPRPPAGQKFSFTPWLTPSATSKVTSPRMASGATSPTNPRISAHTSFSPWYPSSQLASAANSPPRERSLPGRTPRVDGKEFFRQARCRLSYEQFGAFLANIKEFNAQTKSREETLKKAEEIFGTDNKDLYISFHGLLNRKLP